MDKGTEYILNEILLSNEKDEVLQTFVFLDNLVELEGTILCKVRKRQLLDGLTHRRTVKKQSRYTSKYHRVWKEPGFSRGKGSKWRAGICVIWII